jgi:hypothetical protein
MIDPGQEFVNLSADELLRLKRLVVIDSGGFHQQRQLARATESGLHAHCPGRIDA